VFPDYKPIICGLEEWIFELTKAGENVAGQMSDLILHNPDAILICEDITCGIVPMGEDMRTWREEVGRALAMAAKEADEVIRLFCSIPTRLK